MKSLSPLELSELMSSGHEIAIVDIREPYERLICAIPDSVFINMDRIVESPELLAKDKMTVIYCHHGIRSYILIQQLEAGYDFENLYNLDGGINRWADQVDNSMQRY